MQEAWIWFLGWDDPLEKEMASHRSILAWRIHGQRSLEGYSAYKSQESDRLSDQITQSYMYIK